MLYFAWGKARVGSTALNNLFGMAGMPSYYQPLKAILRDALVGSALTPWIVPSATDSRTSSARKRRPLCARRKPVQPAAAVDRGGLSAGSAARSSCSIASRRVRWRHGSTTGLTARRKARCCNIMSSPH